MILPLLVFPGYGSGTKAWRTVADFGRAEFFFFFFVNSLRFYQNKFWGKACLAHTWAQCYKTFLVCKLRIFVISLSVGPC